MVENRSWLNKLSVTDKSKHFDFNPKEEALLAMSNEEETSRTELKYAQVKGTVIHRLLSEEITEAKLTEDVDTHLKNMIDQKEWESNQYVELKQDMIDDLLKYFKSNNYNFIKSFADYKNEFELYHQQSDYYLYGIIDKLIISKDKIIIVDYKTDSIPSEEIKKRANQYFTQLEFYSFIASKLFNEITNFELRIVFIKHPDEVINMNIGLRDLVRTEADIDLMVKKVRGKSAEKSLEHCNNCIFSIKNNCIVT
jgi:ATP-dependent exoDNAse (exonuclease V) beta subunit